MKTENTKCWQGCREKQTFPLFGEMWIVQPWWTVWKYFKTLKTNALPVPTRSLLDVSPKYEVSIPMMYPHGYICCTIHISKDIESTQVPIYEWMGGRECGLYRVEDYLPWRISSFAGKWMNGEDILCWTDFILSKCRMVVKVRNQRERAKERCTMDTHVHSDRRNMLWCSLA